MNKDIEDIERELAASGWTPSLVSDQPALRKKCKCRSRG
jgi:hypothetical protein